MQSLLNVCAVQLEKLTFDNLTGLIVPGDPDVLALRTDSIEKKLHNLTDDFPVIWIVLKEDVILQVAFQNCSIYRQSFGLPVSQLSVIAFILLKMGTKKRVCPAVKGILPGGRDRRARRVLIRFWQ